MGIGLEFICSLYLVSVILGGLLTVIAGLFGGDEEPLKLGCALVVIGVLLGIILRALFGLNFAP